MIADAAATRLADAEATERLGRRLAACLRPGDVVTLAGPLGAGKTSLARGVLRGLGWEGEVPSPSFTLVERYLGAPLRLPVWHADLFRIVAPGELHALALDEAEAGVLLLEWPERLPGGAWPGALALALTPATDGGRGLTAVVPPAWAGRWPLLP